jgi:SEC-C motif
MKIIKSEGVTHTEKILADLCEHSFLKLWSYPNPFKDDSDELCDLLAVFENHVFIFFDRENQAFYKESKNLEVNWSRWKKKVIDDQTRTAHGAERYIKSGRGIFLDKDLSIPFPLSINHEEMVVHKIIVAHGAKKACEKDSEYNVYGSLAISYGENMDDPPFPFIIRVDKERPVHIFDSFNLPIIFNELDTFYDFSSYLDAKIDAIKSYSTLVYCGEEDLIAHYFLNFDKANNKHFIGVSDKNIDWLMVGEGEWKDFVERDIYKNKKTADQISYVWDRLIQKTCQNTIDGTLLGNSNPLKGQSAIHEMAKEPRFSRRALSEHIIKAISDFPESSQSDMRYLSFMPSFYKEKGYVFLQLKIDGITDYDNEYRPARRKMLEIACGAAKNKFVHLKTVVGIAIDSPKYTKTNSEDFILMDCTHWPNELKDHYERENEILECFKSDSLSIQKKTVTEFPNFKEPKRLGQVKVGRNAPCPCGSGKKYKKCCIDVRVK